MKGNIIVTFNVNLNELDLILAGLTNHETVISELKNKLFNEANNQILSFNNLAPTSGEDIEPVGELSLVEKNIENEGEQINE